MIEVALAIALVAVGSFSVLATRRAERRFLAGLCATCSTSLAPAESYRIEGRVVCAACADRVRRRLERVFWGVVAGAAVLLLFVIIGTWSLWKRGDPTWWMFPLFMIGTLGFLALLAVRALRFMKQENATSELLERTRLQAELLQPRGLGTPDAGAKER
jgi:hypothetical protein